MKKQAAVSSEEAETRKFLSAAQTSYQLARKSPAEDVVMEFVTDEILQVVICINTSDGRVDNFQWLFADAIERAAVLIESVKGVPARSIVLGIEHMWQMIGVRLLSKKSRDRLKTD